MNTKPNICDCALCKNNHEFEISNELMMELLSGNVAIFAGAGISTETRNVYKTTFYETIANEINKREPCQAFPELMEEYCSLPNGRLKLLYRIKERFDNIDSFPELTQSATRFHRELGTLFPIRTIITTNWDTYFEDYCRATPFVTDPDLAFWEAADRRVLKIHGSVTNYGSIVATTKDYQKCHDRLTSGIIGATLKTILATRTVIFIGYSLSDSDFSAIYEFVQSQMNDLHKQAYVVTPFIDDCEKFRSAGLIPIQTDGTYFIKQVKSHAVAQKYLLDDDIFDSAAKLLCCVRDEHRLLHDAIKASQYPEMIFAAFYQDGLMHALGRAIEMRGSGQYSHHCRLIGVIEKYLELQKEKLKRHVYEDVSYIEGYINGLTYLLLTDEERNSTCIPMYYAFGTKEDISDFAAFTDLLKTNMVIHKAARKRALVRLSRLNDPESVEFHHPPWL